MQHERCFELSPAEAQVHALRLFFHLLPPPTTSLHLPRSPSTSRHLPPPPSISLDPPPPLSTSLNLRQVHALVRLFLDEAAGAPASGGAREPQRVEAARRREAQGVGGSAIPAPRLPPLAEEAEAEGGGEEDEVEQAEEAREAGEGYAVGISGVFREHPATFRPGGKVVQPVALPAPLSDTVEREREMRLVLSV